MIINRILTITICLASLAFISGCSDDNDSPRRPKIHFNGLTSETHSEGNSITVESAKNHLSGEKHKASHCFSTASLIDQIKGEPAYMVVSCPDGITFDINVEKTGADEEWTYDVYNGSILSFRKSDKLYIADPQGASDSFNVTFTAVFPAKDHIFVSCPGRPRHGQSHRASVNFVLPSTHTRYRVHCTDPNASFGIYEDVSAASDNKIALNVKDGDFINLSNSKHNYYLTDPEGASGPFQVLFEPETVEWMSALNGNLSLADISIPGTHDTGTYALEPVNVGDSKCQNMTVAQQLDFGVRYFDLRVNNSMNIHHGIAPCNLSFKSVAEDCGIFLDNHPGETIIFELTGDDQFPEKFKKYLEEEAPLYVSSKFWRETYVPTLGQVRGKIVMIRRHSLPSSMKDEKWGIDFSGSGVWPDDDSKQGTTDDGIPYYIEDRFFSSSSTDSHDTHVKRDMLNDGIDFAVKSKGYLCILFSSVSFSMSHTPYQFMWGGGSPGVDPEMSEAMRDKLSSIDSYPAKIGIIVMDYYNNNGHDDDCHVTERIINTNFPKSEAPFDIERLHSSYDK